MSAAKNTVKKFTVNDTLCMIDGDVAWYSGATYAPLFLQDRIGDTWVVETKNMGRSDIEIFFNHVGRSK